MRTFHHLPPLQLEPEAAAKDMARATLHEATSLMFASDFSDAGRSSARRVARQRQRKQIDEQTKREFYAKIYNAATGLQTALRGMIARRTVEQKRQAEERKRRRFATRIIQRYYRAYLKRRYGKDWHSVVHAHYVRFKVRVQPMRPSNPGDHMALASSRRALRTPSAHSSHPG